MASEEDSEDEVTLPGVKLEELVQDRPELLPVLVQQRLTLIVQRLVRKIGRLERHIEAAAQAQAQEAAARAARQRARAELYTRAGKWSASRWGGPSLAILVVALALAVLAATGVDPTAVAVVAGPVSIGKCPTPPGLPVPGSSAEAPAPGPEAPLQ